jgi:hypothetical protein
MSFIVGGIIGYMLQSIMKQMRSSASEDLHVHVHQVQDTTSSYSSRLSKPLTTSSVLRDFRNPGQVSSSS